MYSSLQHCIQDLEKHKKLIRIKEEVDPYLEAAEIHRRVYDQEGPAIYFERIKGSPFPAVSNLFGTYERSQFIFRKTLPTVQKLMEIRKDPSVIVKKPFRYASLPFKLLSSFPRKRVFRKSPVLKHQTKIQDLPQIHCWPDDGGAFITLPLVYSEMPGTKGILNSNLGMYRVQLSGNEYKLNEEVGLHYQIHRGIGVHHTKALEKKEKLKVSIFVGGPPAYTLSGIMPLPEGLPEALFAGVLGGKSFQYQYHQNHFIPSLADFCITGTIEEKTLPEGPFGDHLGYYSLTHDFPVLKVENVYHRKGAVWPFTVVGRPPQEDSNFGKLIHEITGEVVSKELPGVHCLNAVDAAGVHPLLLAIGSERYIPYEKREPKELLTIGNAILGFGQCSLAKYLILAAKEDKQDLDVNNEEEFFHHILERVDWRRDLHFQTSTTIDTLDYSGTGLNKGSKLVIAACGETKRVLKNKLPDGLPSSSFIKNIQIISKGILAIETDSFKNHDQAQKEIQAFCKGILNSISEQDFPLIILCDDAEFVSQSFSNFLWITFTRSNPSHDVYGVNSSIKFKHWACEGSLIIDARKKPHHAPELIPDPAVTKKVNRLWEKGGSLYKV